MRISAKVGDVWAGLVLVAVGLAILLRARTFPSMAGLPYGPGLFPSIAAVGLMACGGAIALGGWRRRAPGRAAAGDDAAPAGGAAAVRVAAVPVAVAFFGLALDPLGFHLTAALALLALFVAFGLGPLRAALAAVGAAAAIHFVFYGLLRVPLPWGVLTPLAW